MHTIDFQKPNQLAWLIDPDKIDFLEHIPHLAHIAGIDYFFVGGSLLKDNSLQKLVRFLKQHTDIPVILFPGNVMQLVPEIDAVLFLSLISGRNAEFLIGQHVLAAPLIYHYQIKTIPTGYIIIDGGKPSSVSYISQTMPIPSDKPDIVLATALAGQYLGMQCVYIEAGSGALNSIDTTVIEKLKKTINIPILVGGGINNADKMHSLHQAGANLVVIGTAFEKQPTEKFMKRFKERK